MSNPPRTNQNPTRAIGAEQLIHLFTIGEVHFQEAEVGKGLQQVKTGFFQPNVIVVAQVVYTRYVVSGLEQSGRNMHADETRRSCYENFHFNLICGNL